MYVVKLVAHEVNILKPIIASLSIAERTVTMKGSPFENFVSPSDKSADGTFKSDRISP